VLCTSFLDEEELFDENKSMGSQRGKRLCTGEYTASILTGCKAKCRWGRT